MDFIIQFVLPALYTILLAWLLQKNKTFQQNGFTPTFIVCFFIGKCIAGIVYNYVSLKYIPKGGDIPSYFGDGLELYKTFLQSPSAGFHQLKAMFSFQDIDLLNSHSSFISRVFESIKLIYFVLDFFSLGNLYTDTIIFNGLAVFAFLRLGVFFKQHLKSFIPFVWIFLMPSAFFYTSAIFKEALVLVLMCFMLPLVYEIAKSFSISRVISFLLLFVLMFFFKFIVAGTFLIAMALWWLLLRLPTKRKIVTITFIGVAVACFFCSAYISPKFNMPQNIINRQQEFVQLNANSKIDVPILQPTFSSFLVGLPSALNNVLFKPLLGEGGKRFYLVFTLEMIAFWGFIIFLWLQNKGNINFGSIDLLIWCLLLFGLVNLIIIGYTIPSIGAITRYRSIFLPFIGLFFWMCFNGNRLLPLIRKKDNDPANG